MTTNNLFNVCTLQHAHMPTGDLEAMFRLRYDTFVNRLGWDVKVHEDMECDDFDQPDTHYIYVPTAPGTVDACWRLLPTTGPNMLRDIFPELLRGEPVPCATDCWELSRFAVATDRVGSTGQEFGPLSVELMAESARFALQNGIARYVTVTTAAVERLLRKLGLNMYRLAPPMRYGIAMAVVVVIEVDAITLNAVGMGVGQGTGH
jgi:acyl homoserine lactone synthase